jgi:hypothetical protein
MEFEARYFAPMLSHQSIAALGEEILRSRSTDCTHIISTVVAIMHGELVELTSDVIRDVGVSVPVGIGGVVQYSSRSSSVSFWNVVLVEPVPARIGCMTNLEAYLAAGAR